MGLVTGKEREDRPPSALRAARQVEQGAWRPVSPRESRRARKRAARVREAAVPG